MAKTYQWRASTTFRNLPDPNYHLSHGVTPSGQENWQTLEEGISQSKTYTYYYRDSNTAYGGQYVDAVSSQVSISVTDSWTATIDDHNNLTVTITTTVNSIVRSDARGGDQNTPGRNLSLYRVQGGAAVWSATDNQVATAHTIMGTPLVLGSETFTLAPGNTTNIRSSLYFHNQTAGYQSYDDIWVGVQFRNPLPPDYRPGQRKISSTWESHNRSAGVCSRKVSGTWTELRTLDGGVGTSDPPSIKTSGTWYNQKKIGANG